MGADGSDFPATGESQTILTSALGIIMTVVGGLLITLDKKRENTVNNNFKKN